MKNWQIIAWLILFFPLGIYYMFTQSDWPQKTVYSITGSIGIVLLLFLLNGGLPVITFMSGLSLFLTSLVLLGVSFFKKTDKKQSLALIVSGGLLMGIAGSNIEVTNPEVRIASETEDIRAQEEIDRLEREKLQAEESLSNAIEAVDLAENDKTREAFDEALSLVHALPDDNTDLEERLDVVEEYVLATELYDSFIDELEMAESTPTRIRLDRLDNKIIELDEVDEELIARLESVREEVEFDEAQLSTAKEVIAIAEANPTRDTHAAALLAIAGIRSSTTSLTKRINSVEEVIVANEEQAQKEAEEAEAKRVAEAEKKAEEEAAAAAETQAKADADRKATEKENAKTSGSSQSTSSAPAKPTAQTSSDKTGEAALLEFLNTASHQQLQAVSYIGPKRATYIIEYRQNNGNFTSSSQVKNVKQIGDGIYSNLRDMFNMN